MNLLKQLKLMLIILLCLFDLCLAGYGQNFLLSTALPYFILQVAYYHQHQAWPKLLLSALVVLLESFIRYPDQTPTLLLIPLSFLAAHYLNIELNSRRLTSFILLWLYLGLLSSGLLIQAWQTQTTPVFQLTSFVLELILESAVLAILLQIPGVTKKKLLL